MDEVVQLTGARVALGPEHSESVDIRLRGGRILPFDSRAKMTREFDLSGHLLLPGLINAHDHLEFALFPRLGAGPWQNARNWAAAIHQPDESPVREHRALPRSVRLIWGAIRNLICGVTTVAHHNPFEPVFASDEFPIRVVERFGWAHSLAFSDDVIERRRQTPAGWPFIIHAAEGLDDDARSELSTLQQMGVLDRDTVLVHATGATAQQLAEACSSGASIVWCASSNLFMFGRTLDACTVRSFPRLCLGTDSSLTAAGDMIDELEAAAGAIRAINRELFPLVTSNAARCLRLEDGEGAIREHGRADLFAVPDRGQSPAEALDDLPPRLVFCRGRIVLAAEDFAAQRRMEFEPGMQALTVEGRGRFVVRAPIRCLMSAAMEALGSDIRLAGKAVAT